jgi:integration host factor subunit beta
MANTTKQQIVERIANSDQIPTRVAKNIVQAFLDEIINELAQGNRLEFRDFGVFETTVREARVAQNPKTLEKVHVPAKRFVKFKMGQHMKKRMNQQAGHPNATTDPAAKESIH